MWARIEGDTVAEVTNVDPLGRFHPSFVWVECGEGVTDGWGYVDGAFIEPVLEVAEDAGLVW